MDPMQLEGLAISAAQRAFQQGDAAGALEWLDRVPSSQRPPALESAVTYSAAKAAMAQLQWGIAEDLLRRSVAADRFSIAADRLGRIRRRTAPLGDREWALLQEKVDHATRMRPTMLQPELRATHACGAYYSRGARSGAPWTTLLRMTKAPQSHDADERQAMTNIAGGYMARFALECTDLLRDVDVVVSVPANPGRFVDRGWSFPDELARHLEAVLGLPFLFDALLMAEDVQIRGLGWSERRRVIRGAMRSGDLGIGEGLSVLVVDDVITSGATMREAARVLTAAGADAVSGLAMCHTEG